MNNSEIIIYQSEDGLTKIDCRLQGNNAWLTQAQIAELFQKERSGITKHISNIFRDGELDEKSNVNFLHIPNSDKPVSAYSLDVIIAVGYRVNSLRGTQFRKWATTVLHEYLQKGFAMNDELLKEAGGGLYWKELLERIRDIRTSEKVMYRQVLDLYATSMDYDTQQQETIEFFKIVQNKLHYAVSGNTAAELIWNRANAELPFMGLKNFKGNRPIKSEVTNAKDYLDEQELFVMRRLVSAFFDLAELKAETHEPMYMKDWLAELDKFTKNYGRGVLDNAGKITEKQATEKALTEYEKYKAQISNELTLVEREYLSALKDMQKRLKGEGKDEG